MAKIASHPGSNSVNCGFWREIWEVADAWTRGVLRFTFSIPSGTD
jgi:hypothetical protein